MLVVAHNDWDGVVSALYAMQRVDYIADYQELDDIVPRARRRGRIFFSEAHLPRHVAPGDAVLDHHTPKLDVPARGLTGYLVLVRPEGEVVLVSRNEGRDYSNVHGLASLLDEYGALPRLDARRPPEWLVRVSDVLDNPGIAGDREVPLVLGYMDAWSRELGYRVAQDYAEEGEAALRRYVEMFKARGEQVARRLPRIPPGREPLLFVGDERSVKIAAYVAQRMGRRLVAYAYRVPQGWRVTIVSSDGDEAIRLAERLGGGGRPIPGGGSVGGATAQLDAIKSVLRARVVNLGRTEPRREEALV